MKTLIIFLALTLSSSALASYPIDCEMQMLERATESFNQDRGPFHDLFSLKGISFSFEKSTNRSFVLFKGSENLDEKTCSVKVYMKPIANPAPGCPYYEVDSVQKDCR